jgi:hypothetical protein
MTKVLALLLALAPGLAAAQAVTDVRYEPGDYGTMITGRVVGDAYLDYRLDAKAGQELFVEMTRDGTDPDGAPYFNILPPGSDG